MLDKFYSFILLFGAYLLIIALWKIARWRALVAVFFMGYFFINTRFNTDDTGRLVLEMYKQLGLRSEGVSLIEFTQDYDAFNFVRAYLFWIRVAISITIPLLLLFIWEKFFHKKIAACILGKYSDAPVIRDLINFRVEFKIEHFLRWVFGIAFFIFFLLFLQ